MSGPSTAPMGLCPLSEARVIAHASLGSILDNFFSQGALILLKVQ